MYIILYIYGSSMIVFLVIILLFERRTHDVACRHAEICTSSLSTTYAVHQNDISPTECKTHWKKKEN